MTEEVEFHLSVNKASRATATLMRTIADAALEPAVRAPRKAWWRGRAAILFLAAALLLPVPLLTWP